MSITGFDWLNADFDRGLLQEVMQYGEQRVLQMLAISRPCMCWKDAATRPRSLGKFWKGL